MKETILQYIWERQFFNRQDLNCTDGSRLQIIHPGFRNFDEGPDFFNAKVNIGGMLWAGNIEIHVKSSSWGLHKHNTHKLYESVILHIVMEDDQPILRNNGDLVPTLVLDERISKQIIDQCNHLMDSSLQVPCENFILKVPQIIILSMHARVMTERLERKSSLILSSLKKNNYDWEETTYQLIAEFFGFKVNNEPFLMVAQALPHKILMKHSDSPMQTEALLFGQAGFLEEETDDVYHQELRKEYSFLSKKYNLSDKRLKRHQWKFLRMRPASFPTIRLSQLGGLMRHSQNLFSKIIEAENISGFRSLFNAEAADYWKYNYQFGRKTKSENKAIGLHSIDILIINTAIPLLFAYGIYKDNYEYISRSMEFLEQLPAEKNKIIEIWKNIGLQIHNAQESQASIELYNSYCTKKACLSCHIGHDIIRKNE